MCCLPPATAALAAKIPRHHHAFVVCVQASGVPLDPVYIDPATGTWAGIEWNYMEKRADWQTHLDIKNNRKQYLTEEQKEEAKKWRDQAKQQRQQRGGGSGGAAAAAEAPAPAEANATSPESA